MSKIGKTTSNVVNGSLSVFNGLIKLGSASLTIIKTVLLSIIIVVFGIVIFPIKLIKNKKNK